MAYDATSDDAANLNGAIGDDVVDPVGGCAPMQSCLYQIERLTTAAGA